MPRYGLAVLGGTFDRLHAGHHALLATAFRVGRNVAIGVTSDEFVRAHAKPLSRSIEPYARRRANLVRWLRRTFPGRSWRVTRLEDAFGGSLRPEVDVLIVSAETEKGGEAVNRERKRLQRRPVPVVTVPLVLADDLQPLSSRRIRAGAVDSEGRRLSSIRVGLSVSNPVDRDAVRAAVRDVFVRPRFVGPPQRTLSAEVRGETRSAEGRRTRPVAAELEISVRRLRDGGWEVKVASPRVHLRAGRIRGSSAADLRRGLAQTLRPRV